MDIINVDYILVVRRSSNRLYDIIRVPIDKEYQKLLEALEDMHSNQDRTVCEMQELFDTNFKDDHKRYSYCYPHDYKERYIDKALYPGTLTLDKYQKVRIGLETNGDYEKRIKKTYLKECIRYIHAFCYYKTLGNLKKDKRNKIFSTEKRGKKEYNYPINQDIRFLLKTNFSYGASSYFFVNLTYKGVDILPYSAIVNYFYANMAELVRCTREYKPERDNWNIAFDFVVETTNEAVKGPKNFVEKWIVNEVATMVSGLCSIANNPSKAFSRYMSEGNDGHELKTVRNISNSEMELYKAYPNEMIIAVQAEKISGALLFLTNLAAFSEILPQVRNAIQTIKQLNRMLYPSFLRQKETLNKEIEERQLVVCNT